MKIKIPINENGELIAYCPTDKNGYRPNLSFISFEDCMDFCLAFNFRNKARLMPTIVIFIYGIPDYIDWETTKKNQYETNYYRTEDVMIAIKELKRQYEGELNE